MPHDTKMVDMKLSKNEARETVGGIAKEADTPKYPYGLRLSLDNEELKKLGIKELPKAGEKMIIYAAVDVASSSSQDRMDGGKSLRMELQITDLALMGKGEKESPDKKIYG
jgi:hypothetical protein